VGTSPRSSAELGSGPVPPRGPSWWRSCRALPAFLLLIAGTLGGAAASRAATGATPVGVLPFQDVSGDLAPRRTAVVGATPSSIVMGVLLQELARAPQVALVQPERLAEVLRNEGERAAQLAELGEARQIGRLLAARYMVFGTVLKRAAPGNWLNDTYEVEVSARMVRVDSGTVVFNHLYQKRGSAPCSKCTKKHAQEAEARDAAVKLGKIARQLAGDLLEQVAVEGEIVEVRPGGYFVVGLGSEVGMRRGVVLLAQEQGAVAVDPVTGREVEWPAEGPAVLQVESVDAATCVARCRAGATLHVGDRVVVRR
jgi:TolB-like protein